MSRARECPLCHGEMSVVAGTPPSFLCETCKQTQQPWEHTNPKTGAVMAVLQDWFEALEEGRAESRSPDPFYRRRGEEPEWTETEVNRVIDTVDREIEWELGQRPGYWAQRGFTRPAAFDRLGPAQRRALVQQIDAALAPFDGMPPPQEEPIAYG